ncbi:TetR/AcrR family transcriptional regulator [Lysinibacillus cavernae]|uniref:TetR/AcrR family transcriptional regulator n=1 Tax=Lysinibacillus cavernae TaxID=2666135 RepID=UPI0012D96084|nr:TetR/AcrR family transcriptional regulator [Lysinibacillus cavernae]
MSAKGKTKEQIVKTASRLFQLQGYHATGVQQIIEESESPKGSLYYYFPEGKEQLAVESVQLTAHFIGNSIKESLDKEKDAVKAIQSLIYYLAEFFQTTLRLEGVPIAAVALETSLISDSLRMVCQEAYNEFQDLFKQKLLQANFEEEKARQLGIVVNLMIEGAFLISFTMGNAEPLHLVAEKIPLLLQQ